jgi:hypothetical protein
MKRKIVIPEPVTAADNEVITFGQYMLAMPLEDQRWTRTLDMQLRNAEVRAALAKANGSVEIEESDYGTLLEAVKQPQLAQGIQARTGVLVACLPFALAIRDAEKQEG